MSYDNLGRKIDYVRLSLTDRCDLRCHYCMVPNQTFLPKREVLSFEEIIKLVSFLTKNGVKFLRITGGEPLVRKDFSKLIGQLGEFVKNGSLQELTLTTNGTQLRHYAPILAASGVKRINVSLDSINKENYKKITRGGNLDEVLLGIETAINNNIRVKINCVALKQDNFEEIPKIIEYAHLIGADISLIETMPLDENIERAEQFISLSEIRKSLESKWQLIKDEYKTKGPSQYYRIIETGGRIGFITPLSHNFCETCNRVRITCTGKLYTCLGSDNFSDLRPALLNNDFEELNKIYIEALAFKPKAHDFIIGEGSNFGYIPKRPMSLTGG